MPELIKNFLKSVPNLKSIITTRHGQSVGQIDLSQYRACGDNNLPLTALGVAQARKAGQTLERLGYVIKVIDHSTSLRATQTAGNLASVMQEKDPEIILVPNPLIDKQSFGLFDGLFTDEEKRKAYPKEFAAYKADFDKNGPIGATPPSGESLLMVIERVGRYLKDFGQKPDQPRLVVTHGTDDLIIEALLLGHDASWLQKHLDTVRNVELFRFERKEDGTFVKTVLTQPEPPSLQN